MKIFNAEFFSIEKGHDFAKGGVFASQKWELNAHCLTHVAQWRSFFGMMLATL